MKKIGYALLGGAGVALVVWFIWALAAADAESARQSAEWRDSPRNPINVCIAQGGIPIKDNWSGGLATCQFKGAP